MARIRKTEAFMFDKPTTNCTIVQITEEFNCNVDYLDTVRVYATTAVGGMSNSLDEPIIFDMPTNTNFPLAILTLSQLVCNFSLGIISMVCRYLIYIL